MIRETRYSPAQALGNTAAFARLDSWERSLCLRCNRLGRLPVVRRYFSVVSRLGDGVAWYATLVVLPLAAGAHAAWASLHMAATGLAGLACYKTLKKALGRPRPFASWRAVRALVEPLDAGSFPSGHTLHATCFSVMLAHYAPWLLPLAVPFAASVAASRVILGLHYPSDVAAGAAIGAALAWTSLGAASLLG